MFDTHSDTNKVTRNGLLVRYSVVPNGSYKECTRTATMSYSYVGMTEAAAKACADEKIAKYTRRFARIASATTCDFVTECKTDISLTHGEGCLWNVELSVNETDVKPSTASDPDLAAIFSDANTRNYDDDVYRGEIRITGVACPFDIVQVISYSHDLAAFDPQWIILEGYRGGEWVTLETYDRNEEWLQFNPADTSEICEKFRLRFGDLVSNEVARAV